MDVIKLEAEPRETGSKAARDIRNSGGVPCVLYGPGVEPVSFTVPALKMRPLIFTDVTHRVDVEVNGDSWSCILKDVEFDPIKDVPIHADFQVLQSGRKVKLTVPIRFEGTPIGQKNGGDTQQILTEVGVRCLPDRIPGAIEVEISDLAIGESLHIADLEEEGLEFLVPPQQTIVTVVPPTILEVEPAAGPEVAEEEALEEGEVADEAEADTEGEVEGELSEEEAERDL